MSEIQANFTVEPITAQIVYSTGQINFTPNTSMLTISTGSAPAAAAPEYSIQYNENSLLAGDPAFYYFNNTIFATNMVLTGNAQVSNANIATAKIGNANITTVTNLTGSNSNIHITGGTNGYLLQTDGLGNLVWANPQIGTISANIKAISNANPMVMTVSNTTPYINGAGVTITSVLGANANAIVNGHDFYIKVANNFATSGNVSLYTDANLTVTANGFGLTATANTGKAVTYINTGGGGGNGSPGGITSQIQFNDAGSFGGNAGFSFDSVTGDVDIPGNLSVVGNINVANISANYFIGNGSSIDHITGANVTGTVALSTHANIADIANSVAGSNVSGQVANALVAGTVYTNAQPNITSVGTMLTLDVSGNISTTGLTSIQEVKEKVNVVASAATGTINFDLLNQAIVFYTSNASSTFTLNVRGNSSSSLNSIMNTGESMTLTFINTNGTTPYYLLAFQIDGSSVTPKWVYPQGPPSVGIASTKEIYNFNIIKTASATFTVLASRIVYQ